MISETWPMAVPLYQRGGVICAYALVDADDYERVTTDRWNARTDSVGRLRPMRRSRRPPQATTLARVILGLPPGRYPEVDHRNGDPLDNRRSNLRLASRGQNMQNQRAHRGSHSGVRGVYPRPNGRWQAAVQVAKKQHYLGVFDTVEEAEAVVVAWRREHMPFSEMDRKP